MNSPSTEREDPKSSVQRKGRQKSVPRPPKTAPATVKHEKQQESVKENIAKLPKKKLKNELTLA